MVKISSVLIMLLIPHYLLTMDQNQSFDDFFCSLEKTKSLQDTDQLVCMKKAVFIQLFVQASKNTTLDPQPRQELLEKIKNNSIDINSENKKVYITYKDNEHRLLSYISLTDIKRRIALVNEKEVEIMHFVGSFQTEEDKIETQKEFLQIAAYEEEHKGEMMPIGPCFGGCYSGEEIKIRGYSFEDNLEHHNHVVQQFNELTKK